VTTATDIQTSETLVSSQRRSI